MLTVKRLHLGTMSFFTLGELPFKGVTGHSLLFKGDAETGELGLEGLSDRSELLQGEKGLVTGRFGFGETTLHSGVVGLVTDLVFGHTELQGLDLVLKTGGNLLRFALGVLSHGLNPLPDGKEPRLQGLALLLGLAKELFGLGELGPKGLDLSGPTGGLRLHLLASALEAPLRTLTRAREVKHLGLKVGHGKLNLGHLDQRRHPRVVADRPRRRHRGQQTADP